MSAAPAPVHPPSTGPASPWAFIAPNWFAAVMGTGILPIALLGLPVQLPAAREVATGLWLVAALLLLAVLAATVAHHLTHPDVATSHRRDPVRIHFYGAPAMALMTVGAGALAAGTPVLGHDVALAVDLVLWTVGTGLGLLTTALVPWWMLRRSDVGIEAGFGGWLMPVVPPMVSAATGALLLDQLPAGQTALFAFCLTAMAIAGCGAAVVFVLLLVRLVHHGAGPAALTPTWWIVLGPLGQAVTAAHHLAVRVDPVVGHGGATAVRTAVLWGLPLLGCAGLWALLAALLTHAARVGPGGLPFSLAWWSFTFPVGTVVTGLSGMAELTGSHVLTVLSVACFLGLLLVWCRVAWGTVAGVWSGDLMRAPAPTAPIPAAPSSSMSVSPVPVLPVSTARGTLSEPVVAAV